MRWDGVRLVLWFELYNMSLNGKERIEEIEVKRSNGQRVKEFANKGETEVEQNIEQKTLMRLEIWIFLPYMLNETGGQ